MVVQHEGESSEIGVSELGFTPQPMVRWLGPGGLSATAMQVLLSTIFGAYSDKRDMQAALKEPTESDFSQTDTLWFDFMADTGDGFNPTYTTATVLAQEHLELADGDHVVDTERGRLLLLGGDMAYPAATPTQFRERFLGPMALAFPEAAGGDDPPTLIACAGNHDWYDGLTTFLRVFCQGKRIGGWQTEQTRSYFAIQLPQGWWIFGIDLAFDFFIDAPQMDFFTKVVTERVQPGDRVILATHRPSWLFTGIGEQKLYTHHSTVNLQEFERKILHDHGVEVPLVLAGDIHHYNRYVSAEGDQQRFTAGAGGAFLHPTDYLRHEFEWPMSDGTTTFHQAAVYPDLARSKRMRWGTLLAPFKNPSFVAFIGAFYLVFMLAVRFAVPGATTVGLTAALNDADPSAVAQAIFNNPLSFLLAIAVLAVLISFTDASNTFWRVVLGTWEWLLQLLALVLIIWGVAQLAADFPDEGFQYNYFFLEFGLTLDTLFLIVGVAVLGGYVGSQIFAIFLFSRYFFARRHATHAFSSQRIEDHRCFLRLRIDADGSLTIYPIGIRKVPRRWRFVRRPDGTLTAEPKDRPIVAELIEAPITIAGRRRSAAPPPPAAATGAAP